MRREVAIAISVAAVSQSLRIVGVTMVSVCMAAVLTRSGEAQAVRMTPDLGCGPEQEKKFTITEHKDRPLVGPPAGRAVLHVINPQAGTQRFGVNGKWVTALKRNTYSTVLVDPGVMRICLAAERQGSTTLANGISLLTTDPGKSYYLIAAIQYSETDWKGYLERHKTKFVTASFQP